jgi:hypothetical protein
MAQSALVEGGQRLANLLTQDNLDPRAVLWVQDSDTNNWKLWVVPHKNLTDKREFYREVVKLISENPNALGSLEAGDIEMVSESHPAITELRRMFKGTSISDIRVSNNMLNGFYMPDGIILKMDM